MVCFADGLKQYAWENPAAQLVVLLSPWEQNAGTERLLHDVLRTRQWNAKTAESLTALRPADDAEFHQAIRRILALQGRSAESNMAFRLLLDYVAACNAGVFLVRPARRLKRRVSRTDLVKLERENAPLLGRRARRDSEHSAPTEWVGDLPVVLHPLSSSSREEKRPQTLYAVTGQTGSGKTTAYLHAVELFGRPSAYRTKFLLRIRQTIFTFGVDIAKALSEGSGMDGETAGVVRRLLAVSAMSIPLAGEVWREDTVRALQDLRSLRHVEEGLQSFDLLPRGRTAGEALLFLRCVRSAFSTDYVPDRRDVLHLHHRHSHSHFASLEIGGTAAVVLDGVISPAHNSLGGPSGGGSSSAADLTTLSLDPLFTSAVTSSVAGLDRLVVCPVYTLSLECIMSSAELDAAASLFVRFLRQLRAWRPPYGWTLLQPYVLATHEDVLQLRLRRTKLSSVVPGFAGEESVKGAVSLLQTRLEAAAVGELASRRLSMIALNALDDECRSIWVSITEEVQAGRSAAFGGDSVVDDGPRSARDVSLQMPKG